MYCLCFYRLLIHDEADTGAIGIAKQLTKDNVRSIHPNALVRVMKKGNVLMENEEDMLEDKGGFLRQAWVALKFLKNKVSTDQTVSCMSNTMYITFYIIDYDAFMFWCLCMLITCYTLCRHRIKILYIYIYNYVIIHLFLLASLFAVQ